MLAILTKTPSQMLPGIEFLTNKTGNHELSILFIFPVPSLWNLWGWNTVFLTQIISCQQKNTDVKKV